VKLSLSDGKLVLSVNNPDSGSATEELSVDYAYDPLEIGFNARYLLDISQQLESGTAEFQLADPAADHGCAEDKSASCADADAVYELKPQPTQEYAYIGSMQLDTGPRELYRANRSAIGTMLRHSSP
jgi:hypothetical protein